MSMPRPTKDETFDEYVARGMGDGVAAKMHPDPTMRRRVLEQRFVDLAISPAPAEPQKDLVAEWQLFPGAAEAPAEQPASHTEEGEQGEMPW